MTEIEYVSDITVDLVNVSASDDMVVRAARVSTDNDNTESNEKRDKGLINFLVRERHTSPLEHGLFTFHIEAPLYVSAQAMRHRTWSYNELSGRYTEFKPRFYMPPAHRPLQQVGKPGEYYFVPGTKGQSEAVVDGYVEVIEIAWKVYQRLLSTGVAREVARGVLPLDLMTRWYASVDPLNLMKFLSLRTFSEEADIQSHPQWEIEQVANQMEVYLADAMPVTHAAWNKYGRR